jgi:hypothetical protein
MFSLGLYSRTLAATSEREREYGTEFRRVTRIVMARDAIRVGSSSGCRVGSEVFRGSEES